MALTHDNAGSQMLQNKDKVYVIEVPEADAMPISVQGAVRSPLKTPFADGMTLGDALRLAGRVEEFRRLFACGGEPIGSLYGLPLRYE